MSVYHPSTDSIPKAEVSAPVSKRISSVANYLSWIEGISSFRAGMISFLLALFISVFVTYGIRPLLHIERPLGGEGYDGYLELAQNLVQGNGYVFSPGGHKVFHRPPLYPALLVPGVFLPESLWRLYVAVLNSALFAVAANLILRYGRKLFSKRTAIVAWLLFTLNPLLLVACKNAIPAICQTLTYLLIVVLSWEYFVRSKENRLSVSFLFGYTAALVAASFSHGTMLVHALFLISFIWALAFYRRQGFRSTLMVSLLFFAALLPWTWRNYKVTGLFIPVAGNSGLAYFAGNAHWGITEPACRPDEDRHQAELRHIGLPPQKYRELISFYGLTDPRVERLVNGRFKEHVRTHPVDFGKKLVLNGIEYYAPVIYYVLPPAQTALSSLGFKDRVLRGNGLSAFGLTAFNLVLVFLALAGASTLFQQRAMRPVALVLVAAWAAFMVPYFPFLTFLLGRSCYPFGTFPIISLLAAVSLVHKFPKVRGNELPNSVVQPS